MALVKKRNGKLEELDITKIIKVLQEADKVNTDKTSPENIKEVALEVIAKDPRDTVEIRELVERELLEKGYVDLARSYIIGCYKEAAKRNKEGLDKNVLDLISQTNKDLMTENGNKNPTVISTQRDLIAGEVSKDIAKRYVFSTEVIEAHERGVIHVHDMDYSAQPMTNCCLINLEDMLQNGTMINRVKIDPPKSLRTAMTLTSQISAQVSSNQYGGQTITLSHLAPFVDISRKKLQKKVREELASIDASEELIEEVAEKRLLEEIKDSVQTLNYQLQTISGTNGQSPFVSIAMYLGEVEDEATKADLALLIEEVLKQRIQGFKNIDGHWVAPTFPKLLYILEEDNIREDSKYWYLTELASECISKRMVPDLISEKIMKGLKVDEHGEGHCFPTMGCLDYNEFIEVSHNENGRESKARKIGDFFEHTKKGPDSSRFDWSRNQRRAENIEDAEDRKKFLEKGYLIYSGPHFNQWAKNFREEYGRKPTKEDFKEITGVVWDRQSVMKARGADLRLVSRWDSYLELKVCDILNNSGYHQKFHEGECDTEKDYIRNKVFTCNDDSRKQLDIYFPLLNKGFEINDLRTHSKNSDKEPYYTEKGLRAHVDNYGGFKKGPSHSKKKIESIGELGVEVIEIWEDEVRDGSFVNIIEKELGVILNTERKVRIQSIETPSTEVIDLEAKDLFRFVKDIDGEFTRIKKVIRNKNISNWVRIHFGEKNILVTTDHPFVIEDGQIIAGELSVGDYLLDEDWKPIYITELEPVDRVTYSYDIETESETFVFSGISSHNCRSILSTWIDPETNQAKFYGRFNLGVVSLNLPYIAYESEGNFEKFWELLDKYASLVFKAHMNRVNNLKGATSDVAPILWQHGAISRLSPGEPIEKLFYGGYSTISLGYMGLYEAVRYLTGLSHTDPHAKNFAIKIMKKLEEYANDWKNKTGLGFSVYGTPAESLTGKFSKSIQRDFDPGFKDWITNSFHVDVEEKINAFDKLAIESQFQAHSPGGSISYIETSNLTNNLEAIQTVMKYAYDTIMYCELNTKLDTCGICGSQAEMELKEENGDYYWECPNCGSSSNNDPNFLKKSSIVRRVCGYLSDAGVGLNHGRLADIKHRTIHL